MKARQSASAHSGRVSAQSRERRWTPASARGSRSIRSALPAPVEGLLRLRSLSGAEGDALLLDPELEFETVRGAAFEPPRPEQVATQAGARLLADALRMSLRRGAGPFRSAALWHSRRGHISSSRCSWDGVSR